MVQAMTKNNRYNPRVHISMLARTLLVITGGNVGLVYLTLQQLSHAKSEYHFRDILSGMAIYPGTRGEMTVQESKELFDFFKTSQNSIAMVEILIGQCLEEEARIYNTRKQEDEE
jgi:hypothetical protein